VQLGTSAYIVRRLCTVTSSPPDMRGMSNESLRYATLAVCMNPPSSEAYEYWAFSEQLDQGV